MAEVEPVKLTPREIDERSIRDGIPLRHAGWEELPDPTADGVWPLGLAVVFYAWRDLTHTREQWERLRVWGRELWRDPTDEVQYMPLSHAEEFLKADLGSGIIRAFGNRIGKDGPESPKMPIPYAVWREFPFGIRSDLGVAGNADRFLYSGVTVLRHDVVPLLIAETTAPAAEPEMRGRPEEPAPKRGGGRVLADHWHDMWAEVCRIVHEEGVPADRITLVKRMQQWFTDQGHEAPAPQKLNPVLDRLFKALGR